VNVTVGTMFANALRKPGILIITANANALVRAQL
jgi:hypothetical protein